MLFFRCMDEQQEKEEFKKVAGDFGAALKKIRKEKGLSSTKIARKLLSESSNYLAYEKAPNPELRTIWRICKAMEIEMYEVFLEMYNSKKG